MKALQCYALALLFFLPTTQAQYGHPGADLPERAVMMSVAPNASWIAFFCPVEETCEAHVVCYYKGVPAALDPMEIESKQGARMNLYQELRNIGFSDAAARSRKDYCQVRSAQDIDVRAYTRVGDTLVKVS